MKNFDWDLFIYTVLMCLIFFGAGLAVGMSL